MLVYVGNRQKLTFYACGQSGPNLMAEMERRKKY